MTSQPPPLPSPRTVAPRRIAPWIVGILGLVLLTAALPVLVALGVWSCIRVGGDARALRTAALRASGQRWDRQVEVSAGPMLLGLARLGIGFAPVERDARLALDAVRRAEVAVFKSRSGGGTDAGMPVLRAADATMTRRGWERLVGVVNDEATVAVYVPRGRSSDESLEACVLVLNDEHLVVVSARTELMPLLELAERHQRGHGPLFALDR